MSFLWYALMILAAAGMIFGLAKARSGVEWGRPVTIVCAIVALLLAVSTIFTGGGGVDYEDLRERELGYAEISAKRLGQYISENFADSEVVILKGYEFGEPSEGETARLRGLTEGLGPDITVVEIISPELPEEYKRMMEEMGGAEEAVPPPVGEMMMQASEYNRVLEPYLDQCDIIISLIGLPMDVENLSLWKMQDPPRLALYNTMQMPSLQEAIKQGYIVAAVMYRLDPDMEDKAKPKSVKDFDKRFLLVTPENIEELSGQYPDLFPTFSE
ncbi:MAG: hypothetical protein K9N51_04090 [Candidatus Pacebacteria bacterium]|nr:hypothetical protein [Candidatus Paceibacterota bacterium]